MILAVEELAARLNRRFGGKLVHGPTKVGQITVELPAQNLLSVCKILKEAPEFAFEQLVDLCGVDYSTYGQADWQTEDASRLGFSRGVDPLAYEESEVNRPPRFAVVYHLLSLKPKMLAAWGSAAALDPLGPTKSARSIGPGLRWCIIYYP